MRYKVILLNLFLLLVILTVSSCGLAPGEICKRVQDLTAAEKEALHSLIVKIYTEAFELGEQKNVGYRPAIFRGVKFYALPSSLNKKLDEPIESVSMHSGFVWDTYDEAEKKISRHIHRWSIKIDTEESNKKKLHIIKYEVDYIPGSIGMGSSPTTITIVPIEVSLSEVK